MSKASDILNKLREEESAFEKMVQHLMSTEGYSREEAEATAAKIGREKYGKAGMAKKAAAGREANEAAFCFDTEVKKLMDQEGYDKETAEKVAGKMKADKEKEDDECMETFVDAQIKLVRYDNGDTDSFLSIEGDNCTQSICAPLNYSGLDPEEIADLTGLDVCVGAVSTRAADLLKATAEPMSEPDPEADELNV